MKNIIVILCDSLTYEDNFLADMPLLSKYRDRIVNFTNYFSQAPYTEAAIVPLFSSSNVTDYDGYMNSIKYRPLNINEIFKALGYKTYNTLWFYPNTLSFLRGLDEYDYVDTAFITHYLAAYRLRYFSELYEKRQLSGAHMEMLSVLLEDFFAMSRIYLEDYEKRAHRFSLLVQHTDFGDRTVSDLAFSVEKASMKFSANKDDFIKKLLENGHNLFTEGWFQVRRSNAFAHFHSGLRGLTYSLMMKQFIHSLLGASENQSLARLRYVIQNWGNDKVTMNSIRRWLLYTMNYPGT